MQCSNNLKQWGLAIQNYESTCKFYPFGVIGTCTSGANSDTGPDGIYRRQTFVVALWPYLEQTALYGKWDFQYNFYHDPNRPLTQVQVPLYFCPSDRRGMWEADSWVSRSRSNYVVNWGNGDFYQQQPADYKPSPFGINRQATAAEVRDGLSNTMFMSEVVQAKNDTDFDFRGDIFNNDRGAAQYMTLYTPNSGIDSMVCMGSTPNYPGPCVMGGPVYVSARSHHPGGVMSVFGDGSVHFLPDSIDLDIWQALGSMAGGEVADAGGF